MSRKSKALEIAQVLKDRITSAQLEPGADFPTNTELRDEFGVTPNTIDKAVKLLIKEGLVITYGSGNTKRKVREYVFKKATREVGQSPGKPEITKSSRAMGFLTEYEGRGQLKILDLKIITPSYACSLPSKVSTVVSPPLIFYKTLQLRDGSPVAISESYITNVDSLIELYDKLQNPSVEMYSELSSLGINVSTCEESLTVGWATTDEIKLFGLPPGNNLTVVRITRRVFDEKGNLIELCFLTDRADAYEFVYRFSMKND